MTYFFKKPFGENGDITQIPTNDQGDGNVSYEKGWGEGYELDPNVDPDEARNLSRTNFNGLFFNITSALQQFQKYGVNPYITSQDNEGEVYAYDLGGMCSYVDPVTDEYGVYYSLRSNNTTVPSVNGVTTKFWQRIFQANLDTIKSNRIYNAMLYYSTIPSITMNNGITTFTIYEDTKFLFSNGINSDNSLNNNIVHFSNTISKTIEKQGKFFFFGTSNEDILILSMYQYNEDAITEDIAIEYFGPISNIDCYYFNYKENKWKVRKSETQNFINADYSLCLVGIVNILDEELTDKNIEIIPPFRILSEKEIDKKISKKQNLLVPGRHLEIEHTSSDTDFIKLNLISDTTHFCVNSCNLDSDGDIDLLYIDTKQVSIVEYEQVNTQYKVSRIVSQNRISSFGDNGTFSNGSLWQNNKNAFGTSYTSDFVFTGSAPKKVHSYFAWMEWDYYVQETSEVSQDIIFTFNSEQTITDNSYFSFSYNFPYGSSDSNNYSDIIREFDSNNFLRNRILIITFIFSDDTKYEVFKITYNDNSNTNGWINKTISIPSTYKNKSIKKIKITCTCTLYGYYKKNPIQVQISNIQLTTQETVWDTYIKQSEIEKWHQEWVGNSNLIHFKTGSNYYELLENPDNATSLLDLENARITSSEEGLNQIWDSIENMVRFSDWWTYFQTTYEFLETPEETNNAKLLFRYNDTDAEGLLNNFSIILTYWGGATYTLCDKITLLKTQDVLLDIPDGKYIQKIDIISEEMDQLGNSYLGMIKVYNNVTSGLDFVQYPAIYASSADGNKYFMQNNVKDIIVSHSGYVILSESGAYILPGTNVIRKQKKQPTVNDEPRLTDGDIWLDLSSEPLRAYQYYNGTWLIFNDVPVGYVTAEYLDPIATAEITSETITAVTVNATTFKSKVDGDGIYNFIYDTDHWVLEETTVTLNTYGISITGTPTDGDIISVSYSIGTLTVTNVEQYPINQNGYNVNIYTKNTAALTGKDGRDGQDGKNGRDGKNGAPGAQGPAGVGVPTGGTTGQALVKINNANYNTTWATLATVPSGGTTGQALVKTSDSTGAYAWGTVQSLPIGGTTGQVLAKSSDSNYDVTWTDSLTSSIFNGGTAGQTLIKNSSTNLDFSWGTLEALPSGGNTGQVLAKSSNNDYDASWTTAYYIPSGGTTGQALVKINGDNYNVEWSTLATVPNGGTAGQTLIKNSNTDGDYSWETLEALPEGGTTGQSLVKTSGTDYDVGWETVLGLPSGGSTNYVLSKTSNTDYEVNWRACYEVPDKGLPGQVLTKKTGTDHDISWEYVSQETGADVANINFKTDIYFYASINQYTGVALEQFINIDGIATADQEDVLPYYYIPHKSILNSSEETLVFDLKPINFGGQSLAIYLRTEHTDTVTFSYSTDNGETFTSLSEEVNTPCSTTSLILRITMSAGSEVKNIGLLVK